MNKQYKSSKLLQYSGALLAVLFLIILYSTANNVLCFEKPGFPSTLILLLDTTQQGSMTTVTIKCSVYVAVKECKLSWEIRSAKDSVLEKTILWEGKSDTKFNKQYERSIRISSNERFSVHSEVLYTELDGEKGGSGAHLFIYHHPIKGFLTSPSSFYELDERETWKDAWAKGYKGLSVEEITKKDPELGKRFNRFYNVHMELAPGSADPHPKPKPIEYSEPVTKPKPSGQIYDSSYSPKNAHPENRKQNDPIPYETYKAWQKTNNLGKPQKEITLDTVQHSQQRPTSNLTHEDSVKIQQAIPGIKGGKTKRPPDLNEIDSIGIRMKRESR
jgi:hypothetical protein